MEKTKVYGIARIIEHADGSAQAKIYSRFMSCDEEAIHAQAEELEKMTGQEHTVIDMDSVFEAIKVYEKFRDLDESGEKH